MRWETSIQRLFKRPAEDREAENEDKKTHPHVWYFAVYRLKSGCSPDAFARVRAYIIYK